ncbi:MAG: hypothetical protein FWD76_00215 [Firmicutes bacterium]|nr:hypothetical protein [Bacillota bacterium]
MIEKSVEEFERFCEQMLGLCPGSTQALIDVACKEIQMIVKLDIDEALFSDDCLPLDVKFRHTNRNRRPQ